MNVFTTGMNGQGGGTTSPSTQTTRGFLKASREVPAQTQAARPRQASASNMWTITTTTGKQYSIDNKQFNWIKNRYQQQMADTYGFDDADQLAKRNGQLSASALKTYKNSNVDRKLAELGLPSEKNLEKYLESYNQWHTGTASQLYQGVSSAQWGKMGEFFKNDWQYDYTAEDQARKLKGLMPAAVAAKYADTELDESLMARNLPPSAELGKYAERYDNYNGINTFYTNVAGRWTELRMNDKLDADGNYIKNDDTVYTVDGKKVTGRTLFENEFYDELERTNEDGSLVYGNIYGLFKNNHQYETDEKESENHNIYRGKAITGAGKVEAAADDFANYSAFSYDDFESKYGDYFSKYYADVQLTNTDGTKAMFSDGRPVTVSDALAIFDEAQTEKDRVAFYTIDKLAGDTESSSVSGFMRRWRDKNPGKGYLDMYTDMRDNGVDEKYIKAAKEQNLKAARNIGKDEVKLVKDAWSAYKESSKTPAVASDNATATASDGSVSEVQEESADMRVARQIFAENFTPEQLVNHMNSYDEVINPQIVRVSAKYYANRGIGSEALSDAMKVAKETYIANTDDVDPEIIKAFDESIQTDKKADYAQGKASYESFKRDAILAATDTSTIQTSEDYISRTVDKLGGQVGPDELFEIVKATAECPWANKYAVREALLNMGFTANGEFDNAEYANAWTQGWSEEDRTKFRDLLKQNGYRSLNEIEDKPDTAPEWVEPTKADIDLMKDAGKGKEALVDSMYNYVQSHGGWYGEDRTIKLRSYYKSLGLSEFAINDALLTLDWRYLRGDYKDSPSLGGVEDYYVSVVNPDDTLAAGDWQIARDWMDSVIESGEYTPFEAYNVLCGQGLQDEINAFDADGWHEAIYKEKIVPEMFNASDWDTKMYWEALTPEQQRETETELWNKLSDEDRAAMFDNYDWRYDPNIYRTAGQAWREQFIAVLPSVVSSVSSGAVGFANAVSNLVSGNEDLWGVTKDLMGTDSNVQSFGAVTDGTNGAQLAQLASDAASELIRMQVLGTVGGKLGSAFGNVTGLEFLSDYALAPKGVQKLAGMVVDNVKAFPFSAMAIGNRYAELKLKGASNADALPYSFIIGGLEGVWESFNFDKVFGQVLGNGAFGQMLVEGGNAFRAASVVAKARLASIPVSFLAEGAEEGLSYIAEAAWKTAAAWSGKEWAKDFEFSWKDLGTEVAVGGIIGSLGAGLASPRITRDSIMIDYYRNNGKVTAASVDVDLSAKWWKSFSEERKQTYRNGGARALSMTDFAGVLTQLDNAYRMLYSEDAEDVKNGNSIKNLELSRQKLETDQDAKVKALEREKSVLQGKLAGLNPYNADDMPEFARVSTLIREKDGAIADAKEKRAAALNAADSNIKTKRAELEAQVSQAQNTLASHFAGIYLRNEQAINAKDHATIESNMANARVNGDNVTPESVKEQTATTNEATTKLAEAEANETMAEAEQVAQTPEDAATAARELAYNRVYKDQEAGKAYAEGRRGEGDSKMTRVEFAENERQNFQAKTTARLRRVTLELAGLEAKDGMSAKEIFEEAKKAMTPEAAQKLDMYQKLSKALGLNMVVRDVVAGTSGYVHDGKLYVTLNGKQSMLRVAAHELTHYMKGHAETQYDALRTSLVSEVGQEEFDKMVADKAQEYGLDFNTEAGRLEADDEVCAELCEKMLENPDALERFVQSDLDAAKTLKQRLGKTLVAIKSAIRSIGTSNAETKADLIKQQDTIEQWYKGLSDAIDNANKAGKTTATTEAETATVADTTTEAPQAPPVETNPDLFMGEESARRERLRSDLEELAKRGTKVQDVSRQEVNDVLDRVILGDKSNYNKADYAQIRGMLAQLIPEVTAYVNGDATVDANVLNERVSAAIDYMLERYGEGSEDYYNLRDLIPSKIALTDTAYKDLRAKDMTLRQASNELTKALGGKFVNFVYKKAPSYNNAMTIDELWQTITDQYGEQNGVGNIGEDALALIDYVRERADNRTSFNDLYGSQREDMVNTQVGEFLDAVQSMVEGKNAGSEAAPVETTAATTTESSTLTSLEEDYDDIFGPPREWIKGDLWSKITNDWPRWEGEKLEDTELEAWYATSKALNKLNSMLGSMATATEDGIPVYGIMYDALNNASKYVFQKKISPMAAATVLSDAVELSAHSYRIRDNFFDNHGNFTKDALKAARGIDAQHAAENSALHSLDDDYMPLAERYDAGVATKEETDRLRNIVAFAASQAGYEREAYHGTRSAPFTVFDRNLSGQNYGGYNAAGGGFDFTDTEGWARRWGAKANGNGDVRTVHAYLNTGKPFYSYDGAVDPSLAKYLPYTMTETEKENAMKSGAAFHKALEDNGVDFYDVMMREGYGSYSMYDGADNVSVYNPSQIKSADLVTYDDDGNIIPLSERFDPNKTDIRWTVDDDLADLVNQYGAIEPGREPRARDVEVPKQTSDYNRVSQWIRSLIESGKLTDDQAQNVLRMVVEQDYGTYVPTSQAERMEEARAYIAERQPLQAQQEFHDMVMQGKFGVKTNALGLQLLSDASERGDFASVLDIAADLQLAATEAGQSAQIFNVLKELKGVGSAWYMQKVIDRMNAKYADRIKAGKMDRISVDPALMAQLAKATTVDQMAAAEEAVAKDIARQLPLTWDDRLSSWRYFSMLANPTTHIRNITGNLLMKVLNTAKDAVATGLENLFGIDQGDRAHAILSQADRNTWRSFVEQSYEEQARNLSGGSKLGFESFVKQNMRSFDNKIANALAQFNFKLLEDEDIKFIRPAYKNALMQYMVAQGYTLNEKGQAGKVDAKGQFHEMSKAQMNEAIDWASQQAWKQTFRDASSLATMLNKLSKENAVSRLLIEGVMPFKKTPINIARRGVDYSPAGIIKGIAQLTNGVKKGKVTTAQAIDTLSSGITGSALMALGVMLAKLGVIRAGGEKDKKLETFLEDTGDQTYAMKFGDKSINMSSIAPATIPLFMGVALNEMIEQGGDSLDLSTITDTIAGTLNPFMEMSFMSSLNSALKNYNANGIGGALGSTLMTAAQNYGSQYLPTLGGKIAQFLDPTRRTTKSDITSPVGSNMDYYVRSLAKKVPGLESTLQPDVDVWGRTDTKDSFGDWALDFANKFILPTNIKVTNRDAVDNELIRVVESTGIADFLPSDGAKYFKVKGETYKMNASQYTEYSKDRGQAAYAALKDVMAGASYKTATDEQKAELLKKALDNAYKQVNNVWKEKLGAYDK